MKSGSKKFSGRVNSGRGGLRVGKSLTCLRNSKVACVAGH